jgi:hypothetical protein
MSLKNKIQVISMMKQTLLIVSHRILKSHQNLLKGVY